MSSKAQVPRILKELEKQNPGIVKVTKGRSHWKIIVNGKFAGIYPLTPRREGLAENTKAALRRAGAKVC